MSAEVKVRALTIQRVRPGKPARAVVSEVSFDVAPGARLCLLGPNGAGKTTVLHAMVGALPFAGEVRFGATTLTAATQTEVRRRVGLVFADPSEQFFLPTAREEVEFGPLQRGVSAEAAGELGRAALEAVGLAELSDAPPAELSLGEQRRLALATVLSSSPEVILLDEPTAALDPVARRLVLRAVRNAGATVLLATHDLEAALELEAQVALLHAGRLLALGAAAELLRDQALLKSAGLLAPAD